MAVWNSLTFHVDPDSDDLSPAPIFFSETDLIPDPSLPDTTPQTILAGGGRGRRRRTVQAWTDTTTWASMIDDYYNLQSRTVLFNDGETYTALIEKLQPVNRKRGVPNRVFFTAVIIEA